MQRRRFLQGLTALGAAGLTAQLPRALAGPGPRRIAVVGGGIVGASIAMHLARRGAVVTVLERTAPASGATAKSFAWLNPWTTDAPYRALRLASLAAWRMLDRDLGLGVTWGGYIDWAEDDREAGDVEALAATLDGSADVVTRLDASGLVHASPALEPGAVTAAFLSRLDGHADPVAATLRFLAVARRHRADVRFPTEVLAFETRGASVRALVTDRGRHAIDHLVLAAGVDTPRLLAMLGQRLELRHAPGILAHSAPGAAVTRFVYDGPHGLEFKQRPDGRVVGTDSEEAPDLPVHAAIRAAPIDFPDEALRTQHGRRILDRIGRYLPAARERALERLTLGFRPLPSDGFPVVGPVPGVRNAHVAVTHSGVTLSPILGRCLAAEICDGAASPLLASFRPTRLLTSI